MRNKKPKIKKRTTLAKTNGGRLSWLALFHVQSIHSIAFDWLSFSCMFATFFLTKRMYFNKFITKTTQITASPRTRAHAYTFIFPISIYTKIHIYLYCSFSTSNIKTKQTNRIHYNFIHFYFFFCVCVCFCLFFFCVRTNRDFDGDMLWVYNTLLGSPTFWLLSLFIIIASLLPDYTLKVCKAFNISFGSIYPGDRKAMRAKKLFDNHRRTESTYL